MPSAAFQQALPFILRWEGSYVNHPNDRGGATNKSVTQRVYDGWRSQQGLDARDVRQLDDHEMDSLYESGYWMPPKCHLLVTPLDLVQFDTAVNMGPGRAGRFLQTAVGATPDGNLGPGTQQCVTNCDADTALIAYRNTREAFYKRLVARDPTQQVFMKGWMNRLNALRKHIGLPGFESAGDEVDYGDASYMARVPDIGEDSSADGR